MKIYPYNPEVDKPIYDEQGNQLDKIPTARSKKIYNADGLQLSKTTLNIPQKSGFGNKEHAKKRSKAGRPKGSKSKSTLNDAIKRFESNQLDAAQLIVAVMNGDEAFVGGEIKVSDRIGAAKYVIEAPSKMKRSVGEEKPVETALAIEPEEEVHKPLIQLTVEDK